MRVRLPGRRPDVTDETAARLHEHMARIRFVEEATNELWAQGRISGELHSGIGEEAAVVGVLDHLDHDDAIAVDHRSTGAFVARGVPVIPIMRELLGLDAGLCRGFGGHMHLMSRGHLMVSDGIVGAEGPLACGFALAAKHARPHGVAVAFFGEGAINQGMLLEAMNLAVAWRLPLLFVCKDSRWSITTHSRDVTGGALLGRAEGFGLTTAHASGRDVADVWREAGRLLQTVRSGRPAFLVVDVRRPDGHLLDDPLLRLLHEPVSQARELGLPLAGALCRPGRTPRAAAQGLGALAGRFAVLAGNRLLDHDPMRVSRRRLGQVRAWHIEQRVRSEVNAAVDAATTGTAAVDPERTADAVEVAR